MRAHAGGAAGRGQPVGRLYGRRGTALGGDADRVQGLEAGADDYVAKPFSPRELVLRVAQDADPRSRGRAVRILHFLLN